MIINKAVEKIKIFSVSVNVFDSYSHAVESIIDRIKNGQKSLCFAINPEKIYRVQSDIELKEVINTADIHICDGVGVVIATKILYGRRIHRITGIQLFCDLVARAEKEGLKIFILGASSEANKGACEKLLAKHPNLQIAGRQNGYCSDSVAIVKMINDSGADMLFVAMGSPKQEFWIAEHKDAINAPFCMSIGGTLDVVSGKSKRAPRIFRKTGTEFLYRLIREPKRWKRQTALPKFVLMVLKSRFLTGNRQMQYTHDKTGRLE